MAVVVVVTYVGTQMGFSHGGFATASADEIGQLHSQKKIFPQDQQLIYFIYQNLVTTQNGITYDGYEIQTKVKIVYHKQSKVKVSTFLPEGKVLRI